MSDSSSRPLRIISVSDAFMRPEYYRAADKVSDRFEFGEILSFGPPDKASMRHVAYIIERGGPEALPAPEELYEIAPGYDAIMVHLCPVTRRLIESWQGLKLIMVNRGGTENIDLEAASERGIPVISNPSHNANGVAELTVGLILSQTRNISLADKIMKSGGWCESYPNAGREFELRGLCAGIIGFGSIGRRVGRYLKALGMNLCFTDPAVPSFDPDALSLGCEKADLDELMKRSDIVTLHARSDDLIVSRREFELMKPSAYFINTARPHLVDYAALYEFLAEKKIAGAALDVHLAEPTDPSDPLLKLDNVTVTNHRGGATVNSYSDSPSDMIRKAEEMMFR